MMEGNQQLALRIDGALQAAGQEVSALRAELGAASRRLAELSADGPPGAAEMAAGGGGPDPAQPSLQGKRRPALRRGRDGTGQGGRVGGRAGGFSARGASRRGCPAGSDLCAALSGGGPGLPWPAALWPTLNPAGGSGLLGPALFRPPAGGLLCLWSRAEPGKRCLLPGSRLFPLTGPWAERGGGVGGGRWLRRTGWRDPAGAAAGARLCRQSLCRGSGRAGRACGELHRSGLKGRGGLFGGRARSPRGGGNCAEKG